MPFFSNFGIGVGGIYRPVAVAPSPGDLYQPIIDAKNAAPFAGSIKGHWEFATDLSDRIGGHNGTLGAGTLTLVDGLPANSNNAFDCAGANWVSVAHHADLKPAVGFVMVWAKMHSFQDKWIIAADTAGANTGDFAIRVFSNGVVQTYFQSASVTHTIATSSAAYSPGVPLCIIVAFDTTGFYLFISGNHNPQWVNTSHTTGLTGNTTNWRFGSEAVASNILDGVIDEIVIGNRVPTRAEIWDLSQLAPPDTP